MTDGDTVVTSGEVEGEGGAVILATKYAPHYEVQILF